MRACSSLAVYALTTCALAAFASCGGPELKRRGDVLQEMLPVAIDIKRGGIVLAGSALSCSRPATVKWKPIVRATSEWKTIRRENVKKGSARHDLLTTQMNTRLRRAARRAAQDEGRDCVVRAADLLDAKGLQVVDLTPHLLDTLRN